MTIIVAERSTKMTQTKSKGKQVGITVCSSCGADNACKVFEHEDGKRDAYCFKCETYHPMDRAKENVVPIDTAPTKSKTWDKDYINSLPTLAIRS